jgi:hypothetical protein
MLIYQYFQVSYQFVFTVEIKTNCGRAWKMGAELKPYGRYSLRIEGIFSIRLIKERTSVNQIRNRACKHAAEKDHPGFPRRKETKSPFEESDWRNNRWIRRSATELGDMRVPSERSFQASGDPSNDYCGPRVDALGITACWINSDAIDLLQPRIWRGRIPGNERRCSDDQIFDPASTLRIFESPENLPLAK